MNAIIQTQANELAQVAEQLARRHWSNDRVDPEHVARAQGLPVFHTAFAEEIDGLLVSVEGSAAIVVNTRRSRRGSERSRFTVAHELGHWFAGGECFPEGDVAARMAGPPRREERPADRFAAHLLMPRDEFVAAYHEQSVRGLRRIARLARRFRTSLVATAYRAVELNCALKPNAVLVWNELGQRCGRRVSPATLRQEEDWFELASVPPANSVTAHAIENFRGGLQRGVADVLDWFTELSGLDVGHHRPLREEVLARGGHGWITWLEAE